MQDVLQGINVEELARHIAFRMDPEALLTAEDIGVILNCTARYVRERFAGARGFPKPIYLPLSDGSFTNPKWRRSEIDEWIDEYGVTTLQRRGPKRGQRRII